MFVLSALTEDVKVEPSELAKSTLEAVQTVLERTYIDKVVPNLGLVVTLYDIQSVEGGTVYPNHGAAFFKVAFRLVVFRPFPKEVLVGTVLACSKENGLKVSLGDFFSDIHVPVHLLQEPASFDDAEKLWAWNFDGNVMFMELGHQIRIRVHSVRFNTPPTPLQLQDAKKDDKQQPGTKEWPFAPMEVIGDVNDDGLGMLSWWGAGDEDMEEQAVE